MIIYMIDIIITHLCIGKTIVTKLVVIIIQTQVRMDLMDWTTPIFGKLKFKKVNQNLQQIAPTLIKNCLWWSGESLNLPR